MVNDQDLACIWEEHPLPTEDEWQAVQALLGRLASKVNELNLAKNKEEQTPPFDISKVKAGMLFWNHIYRNNYVITQGFPGPITATHTLIMDNPFEWSVVCDKEE